VQALSKDWVRLVYTMQVMWTIVVAKDSRGDEERNCYEDGDLIGMPWMSIFHLIGTSTTKGLMMGFGRSVQTVDAESFLFTFG
jgi:hypothetical protein